MHSRPGCPALLPSFPAIITHLAPLVALAALDPLLQLLLLDSPLWASRQHTQGVSVLVALLHQVQQRTRVAPAGSAGPGCHCVPCQAGHAMRGRSGCWLLLLVLRCMPPLPLWQRWRMLPVTHVAKPARLPSASRASASSVSAMGHQLACRDHK